MNDCYLSAGRMYTVAAGGQRPCWDGVMRHSFVVVLTLAFSSFMQRLWHTSNIAALIVEFKAIDRNSACGDDEMLSGKLAVC